MGHYFLDTQYDFFRDFSSIEKLFYDKLKGIILLRVKTVKLDKNVLYIALILN